jgi:hypothetical protein
MYSDCLPLRSANVSMMYCSHILLQVVSTHPLDAPRTEHRASVTQSLPRSLY